MVTEKTGNNEENHQAFSSPFSFSVLSVTFHPDIRELLNIMRLGRIIHLVDNEKELRQLIRSLAPDGVPSAREPSIEFNEAELREMEVHGRTLGVRQW